MSLVKATDRIVRKLIDEHDKLSKPEIESLLVQLKTNGRNCDVSKSLRQSDLERLLEFYVTRKNAPTHKSVVECLTVLANALVWDETLLREFDPTFVISRVLNECFQPDVDPREEYLYMRLLFLFTFHGRLYEEKLIKTGLAAVASKIAYTSVHEAIFPTDMDRLSFIECMKFTFNLLHHYPKAIEYLQGFTARAMVKIFYTLDPRGEYALCQHIANCLLCLPVGNWLYESDSVVALERIMSFIEIMVNPVNQELREDRILSPPLSLLHCIISYLFGSDPDPELQEVARRRILPSAEDRQKVLGSAENLSSYLLQITIDPVLRTTRNIIFDIFWKVSHEDPDEFVGNFGLGFASSFLASHGIAFPESINTTDAKGATTPPSSSASSHNNINPITGQYLAYEKHDGPNPVDEMTEEEKERDAERMFVLFERLKASNVIKVENPVEFAARKGELK